MISFRQRGDFSKLNSFLNRIKKPFKLSTLDKYGRDGVAALRAATPVDSGLTADSWSYKIEDDGKAARLIFSNSHINDGVPIAIILQYGHGTGTGGWVEGIDYINPALEPIFQNILNECWKEVTKS